MTYLYLFLQSNLLEAPAYLLFLKLLRPQWSVWKSLCFMTAFNSITHPVVFFLIMNFKFTYLQNILLAEAFAIGAEALVLIVLLRARPVPALSISAFANFLSWQLAPMLTYAVWG